jgi:restriction system protein
LAGILPAIVGSHFTPNEAIMSTETIWVVRAGKHDEARNVFLDEKHPVLALGWLEMPDLSKVPPNREAFKKLVGEIYPNSNADSVANNAGQLFRFVHAMKDEELVLYPCKTEREIYFGRVSGPYFYSSKNKDFPHQRPVKWLKSASRLKFSQGALYEIGSALTVFQIKNFASEFLAVLSGKKPDVSVKEDSTIIQVQTDIEESTRDFIIKTLAQELKGHPLADFVAHLLNRMGYQTRVSPEGADGGVDIIAHKDELGFEPPIVKVQVKSGEASSVSDPTVTALYGKVASSEFGLFVTLGTFTTAAKQFARGKSNLRLIDGTELVDLIQRHYEQFDSRYKSVLPLKRVYVPDPEETLQEE